MTFDIRAHIEKLVLDKENSTEYRYTCPICEGNNLTISKDSGAYQCWNGCDVADIRNAIAPLNLPKSPRQKSDRTWAYTDNQGNPLIRTRRIDDGQGNRRVWQEYLIDERWQSKGSTTAKVIAKKAVMPYNYAAVQEAIGKGEPVFWVEGEPCVDALKSVGLVATTSIGGSASYRKYGDYSQVLQGAKLVISPDGDIPGLKYAEEVAKDYPEAQWLYPPLNNSSWSSLTQDGGLDVADWIKDLRREELSTEHVRDRILAAVEPQRRGNPLDQGDSDDFASLINALHKIFTESESAAIQRWELIRLSKCRKIQVKDLTAIYDTWRDDQDDIEPMTLDQFKASVPNKREWLIASILPDRTTGVVHSDAGVGKTLLFYSFGKAIAKGSSWNGYPTKQGKVLIVQTDEPSSETHDRFEVSGIFEDVPADQILMLTRWGFSQIRKLERWIETYQPAFVVIDSLTTANRRNTSEEKDSPYGHCLSDLRDLADRYGCSIWVLHHSNRQGGLRGTTAIEANVSEVWKLRKPHPKENLGKLDRILEVGKSRAGSTGNYHLRLDVDDYSWKWLGDKDSTAATGNPSAELLSFMLLSPHLWFEPQELSFRGFASGNREAVRKQLERLKRKGLLQSEERIKQHANYRGSTRYRVYRAVIQEIDPDAEKKASSSNVQCSDSSTVNNALALDAEGNEHTDSEKISPELKQEENTIFSSPNESIQCSEKQDIQALPALDVSARHIKKSVQRSEPLEVIEHDDDY